VLFFNTTGDEALATFTRERRQFSFCFIDHSHRYEHVAAPAKPCPR
jgi:hypothetical protein